MKSILFVVLTCVFMVSCAATSPQQSTPIIPTSQPELKLKITGVNEVKAETSDVAERELALQEKKVTCDIEALQLEKEKWEYEKAKQEEEKFESQLSHFVDWRQNPPVFTLYSVLTLTDWKSLKKDFAVLFESGKREIVIDMQTGGGSVFAGQSLADTIMKYQRRGMNVKIHASGIIASAAVPIFAVGSNGERTAGKNTLFMVHEASMFKFLTIESHSDIRAQKEMMDLAQKNYITTLVEHSKKPYDFWLNLEGRTTWFSADQAKEWGLVDRIE